MSEWLRGHREEVLAVLAFLAYPLIVFAWLTGLGLILVLLINL